MQRRKEGRRRDDVMAGCDLGLKMYLGGRMIMGRVMMDDYQWTMYQLCECGNSSLVWASMDRGRWGRIESARF